MGNNTDPQMMIAKSISLGIDKRLKKSVTGKIINTMIKMQ
jgi:hypothetical protein